MKIYDCFSYWDENFLLDLRLNILNEYVDYFVIVEGNKTWQDNEKKLQSSEERHPLNAIGDPKKMAKVIYNLFSAKEDWITGQTISIDGGLSSLR